MKGLDLMPLLKKTIHESDQILKQNPLAAHFIPPAAPAEEPAEERAAARGPEEPPAQGEGGDGQTEEGSAGGGEGGGRAEEDVRGGLVQARELGDDEGEAGL